MKVFCLRGLSGQRSWDWQAQNKVCEEVGNGEMKKERSVTFNFIMNFILTASSFVFPLITFPYVSRVLLPVGNGKIASATAIVSYFSMVSMLGIPTYGIRACAQVREDKEKLSRTVQEILIINVAMTVLVYIVFGACLYLVPKFAEDRMLLAVVGTTILLNVIGVSWLYAALEQYAYITVVSLVFKVVGILLMFLFVKERQDYVIYGGITVISNVGSYVFNFLRLGKYIILKPLGGYNLRRHLKPIGIFCAMTVATSIYTNLDTVMLKFISGDEQVGYYTAAVKVKTIVASLVTSIGTVLLPRLSFYVEKGMQEEFKRMASKALCFVAMVSLPLTVYFMMFAGESIGFLSGAAYRPATAPMCLIMPTVVFIGMSNILGMQVLVPTDREKEVLKSVVLGGIVDMVLNLALIPKMGASGASIGTLAAELAVLAAQMVFLRGFLQEIRQECRLWPYLLAALPAVAVSWLLKIGGEPLAAKAFPYMRAVKVSMLDYQGTAGGIEIFPSTAGYFIILAVTGAVFFGIYGGMLLLAKEPIVMEYVVPYLKKLKIITKIGSGNKLQKQEKS